MSATLRSLATIEEQGRLELYSPVASKRERDEAVIIKSGEFGARNVARSQCRPRLPAQEGSGWDSRRACSIAFAKRRGHQE
jgi:hypothetical protein